MASIVKRKKKYSVVYTYTDENGNKRQKWETFETNAEAKKRKLQVEYEQESGTFIPPSAKTVNDLLDEYMSIYGVNTWAMSTYESRKSLIANYIRPLIGDMKLEDVTPRIMDKYYRDLLSVKAVSSKYVKARTEYLTPHTVREVNKTLRNAFNQAVKWELMTRNPVEHATLPKEEHKTRDIWTAEVLQKALEACDDDILRLAINLAFSCSLRMGELLGLTWDCIDISPTSIELGQASIFVEKELQRVNREAMADLDGKDIMFKFPPTFSHWWAIVIRILHSLEKCFLLFQVQLIYFLILFICQLEQLIHLLSHLGCYLLWIQNFAWKMLFLLLPFLRLIGFLCIYKTCTAC